VRNTLFAICCVLLLALSISAQQVIVEIEKPQPAKSVAGVVVDPSGAALSGVTVEERSQDWKVVLRSTETDENGRFHFASRQNKTLYYLYFSHSGFNWLRIKLQVNKKAKSPLVVKMPIGT
jgi:Carboxypeptidase regulatory-like domain